MTGGTMELRNYVGGSWVTSSAPTFVSTNPMNGETVATAPASDAADVDAAVRAAREAVDSRVWSDLRAAFGKSKTYAEALALSGARRPARTAMAPTIVASTHQ